MLRCFYFFFVGAIFGAVNPNWGILKGVTIPNEKKTWSMVISADVEVKYRRARGSARAQEHVRFIVRMAQGG
jgi:hypothetical protein